MAHRREMEASITKRRSSSVLRHKDLQSSSRARSATCATSNKRDLLHADEESTTNSSLTVIDNRSGRHLTVPIETNTVRATSLRKLTWKSAFSTASDSDLHRFEETHLHHHRDASNHDDDNEEASLEPLRSYDPGYMNTACCSSRICYIDGIKGILRYRGYPIEALASQPNVCYEEVSFLLLFGELPTAPQLRRFRSDVALYSRIPTTVKDVIRSFSSRAHPMGILMSAMAAMGVCRPETNPSLAGQAVYNSSSVRINEALRLLAAMPVLAATIHRHLEGLELHDPPPSASEFTERFMSLLDYGFTDCHYSAQAELVKAMDTLLILHAEHELNCSTAAVRHLASSNADIYTCVASGIGALYGPRHGGANEAVVRMLEEIGSPENIPQFIQDVKDRKKKLMGFGHRVYKSYDPRATLIRRVCEEVFKTVGRQPLIEVAIQLESIALKDEYFTSRNLYPNVDFYSGLIYRAMGFAPEFYPVLFAVGRVSGWLAHWLEFQVDPENRIARPFQVYKGYSCRSYVPMEMRSQLVADEEAAIQVTALEARRRMAKL